MPACRLQWGRPVSQGGQCPPADWQVVGPGGKLLPPAERGVLHAFPVFPEHGESAESGGLAAHPRRSGSGPALSTPSRPLAPTTYTLCTANRRYALPVNSSARPRPSSMSRRPPAPTVRHECCTSIKRPELVHNKRCGPRFELIPQIFWSEACPDQMDCGTGEASLGSVGGCQLTRGGLHRRSSPHSVPERAEASTPPSAWTWMDPASRTCLPFARNPQPPRCSRKRCCGWDPATRVPRTFQVPTVAPRML